MIELLSLFAFIFLSAQPGVAQDSPLQADPGTAPPPQGWKVGAPDGGGIHLPSKNKKKLRLRRQGSSNPSIDMPSAEGEHPVIKSKKSAHPQPTP
jgi:hypothetical protein